MRRWETWSFALLCACGRVGFDEGAGPLSGIAKPVLAQRAGVAVAGFSTCAVRPDDSLWCWGGNYGGELGTGDYNNRPSPVQIAPERAWRRVTNGLEHVCALDADGAVYCWGFNGDGELGVGDYQERTTPARLTIPGFAIAFDSGYGENQAIVSSGARWGWGDNRNSGTLGIGSDFGPVLLPVAAIGRSWASLSTGYDVACGIKTDGSLWCWGTGAIGDGLPLASHFEPVTIEPASTWRAVATFLQVCAIRTDDALFCWGSNSAGEVGIGTTSMNVLAPAEVMPGTRWLAVDTGLSATCGIRADASLWCWGRNTEGQLGVGDNTGRSVPTAVMPGTRWQSVAMSPELSHACGVQEDDSVWCWGKGADGQLGQGDVASHTSPVRVPLL